MNEIINQPQVPEVIRVSSSTLMFVVQALLDHAASFEQAYPTVQRGTDRIAVGTAINLLRKVSSEFAALADDVRSRRRPGWEDLDAPPLIVIP